MCSQRTVQKNFTNFYSPRKLFSIMTTKPSAGRFTKLVFAQFPIFAWSKDYENLSVVAGWCKFMNSDVAHMATPLSDDVTIFWHFLLAAVSGLRSPVRVAHHLHLVAVDLPGRYRVTAYRHVTLSIMTVAISSSFMSVESFEENQIFMT